MIKSYLSIGILMFSITAVAQNTFPNSGKVGIGTTTPSYNLEVQGGSALFRLVSSNSSPGIPAIDMYDHVHGTEFVLSPSAGKVDMFTYSNHALAFGTGASEKMRIAANGNVGIGTSNPGSNLQVGNAHGSGITLSFDGSGDYRAQIVPYWNSTKDCRIDFNINRSGGITPSTIMSVGYDGNVGIGTIIPNSKLAVNGNIRAHEIKVETANWPDYVFAKDYQLPTLQETEKHIKDKGHLPGIPSAVEVKANGVDLGEMNAKLLQKIEELTLHLIDLKKTVNEQQTAINHLKSKL